MKNICLIIACSALLFSCGDKTSDDGNEGLKPCDNYGYYVTDFGDSAKHFLAVTLKDSLTEKPLAGFTVKAGKNSATTDAEGKASLEITDKRIEFIKSGCSSCYYEIEKELAAAAKMDVYIHCK